MRHVYGMISLFAVFAFGLLVVLVLQGRSIGEALHFVTSSVGRGYETLHTSSIRDWRARMTCAVRKLETVKNRRENAINTTTRQFWPYFHTF